MNSYTYTPFGELLTGEGSGFRFNGEYYDSATGMVNLRARQYEPSVMRFRQRDLLKGDQSAPLSLNRYLYCENDSVNFVDPSGRSIADLWNKAKTAVSNGVAAVKKVTAAAKNVVSVAKENVKSFITETKSKVSNSVAEAKAEVKNGIIKTAVKITSAATTLTNNVKTTISNTRTNVLDWYGRNEETITKCLKTAAVVLGTVAVVALTVASAGAVAAAAGVMFAGTALAGSAATLATIGVYGLATVTGLFGASNVGEIWSGNNVVRDTVFGGNKTAYDYTQAGLTVLSMGTMQFGSYNSGLVRSASTADAPTDEVVGSSAGSYAGRQATGTTKSGNVGTQSGSCGQRPDFYVKPNGEVIPATGYRYMDSGNASGALTEGKQYSTYFGFDKYGSAASARDAYQISPNWSDARVLGEFDTLQVIDKMYVPTTFGNTTSIPEPFAVSYSEYGVGGAQQYRADSVLDLLNVSMIGD